MALPHLTSGFTPRGNIYKDAVLRRHSQETDREQVWNHVSKYFHHQSIVCQKENDWSSKQSWQNSMDAFSKIQDQGLKTLSLTYRRNKLSALLAEERDQYQAQLSAVSKDNLTRLTEMKERSEELKSVREGKRKQLASDLLYERWRKNDPTLRRLKEEQHRECVIGEWVGQKVEKYKALESNHKIEEAFAIQYEEERRKAVERMQEQNRRRLEEEKKLKVVLKDQVEELRRKETEVSLLRKEQEALMMEKCELDKLEEERKQEVEMRKKKELGRGLLRQHAASLKRKSKQVQEELERDRMFLVYLAEKESDDNQQRTSRRDKARAHVQWMKQVIEDQLKVEKSREAELEMLYADEAAKEWGKREAQWTREQVARERLMQDVLEGRQDQIQNRMATVKEEQEVSLRCREELLRELEIANQLTRRDVEQEEKAKADRKEHIQAQIAHRLEDKNMRDEQLLFELAEKEKQEADYEEYLQLETERMKIVGFQPEVHTRGPLPKTAWM